MQLEKIGFYTLTDKRASTASSTSPLSRCELLLTGRCNFKCLYCRGVGGRDIEFEKAVSTLRLWGKDKLFAVRFSGGEPLLYPRLSELVKVAKELGIKRVAVSSNGSLPLEKYVNLINSGVDDFSISLDACCASTGDTMAGKEGSWEKVVENIKELSKLTYLSVGIVLTKENLPEVEKTVKLAMELGVTDIRVIPAAQDGEFLTKVALDEEALGKYPILKYRLSNFANGRKVRGLSPTDSPKCALVLDDMAVCGDEHFPCIIYLREGGKAIGKVGDNMRQARADWWLSHNSFSDSICSKNCLDVCVDYNNRYRELHEG